jgi:tetratricopeptide (TPR) repeat protein
MTTAPDVGLDYPLVTDGDIAVNNLESARQNAWNRFWFAPQRLGIAEHIVEQEQLMAHFLGDPCVLDRLETLVAEIDRVEPESSRTALLHAQVLSMEHRFADAREYLARAAFEGLSEVANCVALSIDQACGTSLDAVLKARRRMVAQSDRLEDLVPLGALFADLGQFVNADEVYRRALRKYRDTSPFPAAWVCFQLGVLWGELVPDPQLHRAARWYQKAIGYVPCYVKARVHLLEIYLRYGSAKAAETLLYPAVSNGDPEVHWRGADVLFAMGRVAEAEVQMEAARSGFETLLAKHLLAFADHGAEFYSGSGNNLARAFELATINLENRPTLRAFERAYQAAISADESKAAAEILAAAQMRWGATNAFCLSSLAGRADPAARQLNSHSYGETHDDAS